MSVEAGVAMGLCGDERSLWRSARGCDAAEGLLVRKTGAYVMVPGARSATRRPTARGRVRQLRGIVS